ncbi:hypothetical protein F5X96DRAFT_674688 [Biscogniauxia mediterranea]|nr:hypothetical protein F5X96DRAFT_674688 [Biscogniauxia mediterranea]
MSAIDNATISYQPVQDPAALSETLSVTIKNLPVLYQKKYKTLYEFAEMCRKRAGYFEHIFGILAVDNAVSKLDRYRNAVTDN